MNPCLSAPLREIAEAERQSKWLILCRSASETEPQPRKEKKKLRKRKSNWQLSFIWPKGKLQSLDESLGDAESAVTQQCY